MLGISPRLGPHHTFLMQRFHLPLVLQAADYSLTTSTDTQLGATGPEKTGFSVQIRHIDFTGEFPVEYNVCFFWSPVPAVVITEMASFFLLCEVK